MGLLTWVLCVMVRTWLSHPQTATGPVLARGDEADPIERESGHWASFANK